MDHERTWALLRPFFAARLGDAAALEMERSMRDTGGHLGAPQTFQAVLHRLASAPGPMDNEQALALMQAMPALLADMQAAHRRDEDRAKHPLAQALAASLSRSAEALTPARAAVEAAKLLTPATMAQLVPPGSREMLSPDLP